MVKKNQKKYFQNTNPLPSTLTESTMQFDWRLFPGSRRLEGKPRFFTPENPFLLYGQMSICPEPS